MFGFRRKTLEDLEYNLPFDEIRKRARILVIDDDEQAFPYKLLQKEGYNVHYWPTVHNLRDLEAGEFDIIILDIFGVAPKEISSTDGLGVLEHLKKHNPAQLVIAYSGQKYDLSQASFWSLADDYLGKPSSLIDCKEKIDSLLRSSFTPQHYWQTVITILQDAGVTPKQLQHLERAIVRAIRQKSRPNKDMLVQGLAIAHHTAATIWVLVQVILKFYSPTP